MHRTGQRLYVCASSGTFPPVCNTFAAYSLAQKTCYFSAAVEGSGGGKLNPFFCRGVTTEHSWYK